MEGAVAAYPDPSTKQQQIELSYLHEVASYAAINLRQFDAAKDHEMAAIRLLEAADNRQRQAFLYHQLGIIAGEQRQFADAEASYRQALNIYLEYGDQHRAAITAAQLKRVLARR